MNKKEDRNCEAIEARTDDENSKQVRLVKLGK